MYCKLHRRYHQHQHHACKRYESTSSDSSSTSSSDSETGLSNVVSFAKISNIIKSERSALMDRFPRTVFIPYNNDMEWCSFCLGAKMCLEIYGEQTEGEKRMYYRRLPYRRLPLLSILLHMQQKRIKHVLRYLHQWFLLKGMKHLIAMWMYALLTCLDDRGVDEERDRILASIYKDCKMFSTQCAEWQKPRVELIIEILYTYFIVDTSDDESE